MRPVVAWLALTALVAVPAVAEAQSWVERPDTLRARWEFGASSDYTNEIYYLDSLATPTLVERQRLEIPEQRYAGVVLAGVEGTRAMGRSAYSLTEEVSYGDLLRRASTSARWRQSLSPQWQLLLSPRAEYRRDRTLGRDFEEYQAAASARLRRNLTGGLSSAEAGILGDWLRTTGSGTALLPDRWTVGATAGLEDYDFSGADWRLDYTFRGRVFPDSSVRDHYEHETLGRMRLGWGIANFLILDAALIRRVTMRLAPTSRDNFWEESGALDLAQNAAGTIGWPARVEFDAVQFDLQDAVLYFDHQQLRARTGVRLQPTAPWTLEAGPLGEWLRSPRAPDEAYDEYGGFLEFEAITSGCLWTVTPSTGARNYHAPSTTGTTDVYDTGRSSYRYFELDALGDQRIPGGFRARVMANTRFEFHDESREDATSLYFSLDVRRLF